MPVRGVTFAGFLILLVMTCAQSEAGPPKPATTKPTSKATSQPASVPEKPIRIAVVVSPKNPITTVSSRDLHRIFLRQKTKWPNHWKITVYDQHTKNPIRTEFSRRILGKTPAQLKEYWLNLKLTRGLKPSKTCRSPRLVKQYLKRVKGGIGYLYEDEVDKTVKVIKWIELDRKQK
ncbi:MAG: hypothetical protein ACE5EQ_02295 [Phycisphaerae bacterium]